MIKILNDYDGIRKEIKDLWKEVAEEDQKITIFAFCNVEFYIQIFSRKNAPKGLIIEVNGRNLYQEDDFNLTIDDLVEISLETFKRVERIHKSLKSVFQNFSLKTDFNKEIFIDIESQSYKIRLEDPSNHLEKKKLRYMIYEGEIKKNEGFYWCDCWSDSNGTNITDNDYLISILMNNILIKIIDWRRFSVLAANKFKFQ